MAIHRQSWRGKRYRESRLCRVLGNPILNRPLTPSKLAEVIGRQISTINIHLAKLRNADVVRYDTAPHKPLLAPYAIGRVLRGEPRMVAYSQVDRDLGKLLMEFGPRRQSYHPEYPFWRLQNDYLRELTKAEGLTTRRGNTDAKKSELPRGQCRRWLSARGTAGAAAQQAARQRNCSRPADREFP